jgi:hypothetical protein
LQVVGKWEGILQIGKALPEYNDVKIPKAMPIEILMRVFNEFSPKILYRAILYVDYW